MADPITDYYADNPWGRSTNAWTTNVRHWYVPELLAVWRQQAIYQQYLQMKVQFDRAKEITFNQVYDLEPNVDPLSERQLWLPAEHTDSNQRTVTLEHHGQKVALHVWDDRITYWTQNGKAGLRPLIRGLLGRGMVDYLDILARNAFLAGSYSMYSGNASSFGNIGDDDLFDLTLVNDMWLGMSYRTVPVAQGTSGAAGTIVCITTPGVIHRIQTEAGQEWEEFQKYSDKVALFRYEVGMYRNVRFVQTARNTLYNCGEITKQVTVTSAINAGAGAAGTVDGVISPGQSGATAYIQCAAFSEGDFVVNEIVTIHTVRTSANGVSDGVDYTSGKTINRRVVTADHANNRLGFDIPIMQDFDTDLGAGVYAYVTKGRHVHASIFIGAPDSVCAGISVPPTLHFPPVIDDTMSMVRMSWTGRMKYQGFNPGSAEVVYSGGYVRVKGAKSLIG